MTISIYKIVCIVLLLNLLLMLFTAIFLFDDFTSTEKNYPPSSATSGTTVSTSPLSQQTEPNSHVNVDNDSSSNLMKSKHISVEIWSKAAIGQYVWENILRGSIDDRHSEQLYIEGNTKIGNATFKFRSGPSLKLQSLLSFPVENIVLILNWRNAEKINYSLPWIEAVQTKEDVRNVGLIALGDEQCNNKWFLKHFSPSGKIRFLFVIYDWNKVDNERIYQWPLGLATYRDFPSNDLSSVAFQTERPYLCNFIATVYPNSSRQELANFFDDNAHFRHLCLVKARTKWQPHETEQTMAYYVEALKLSELTLSPVGLNHECYRILEAVEYGSVPVIEIDLTRVRKGSCDRRHALRLFHQLNAPFIYVRNWTLELPSILQAQRDKSLEHKTKQRIQLIKWYHKFKMTLRNRFINVIQNKFT